MASVSVFICPGSAQSLTEVTPDFQAPACANGLGAWQQVNLAEPFDPSQLDHAELMDAGTAGFVVCGTLLVFVLVGRFLLAALAGRKPPM